MKSKSYEYDITIRYNGDPTKIINDHDSESVYLTEVKEMRFKDIYEAVKFLSDCNSPITTIKDLLPDIDTPKGFKPILPEKNIKIKHQATSNIDNEFDSDAEDWE